MRLKIRNGFILNEDDVIIGTLTDAATYEEERIIEMGSEAIPAIEEFIASVNSGKFKPRTAVREFEKIIEKYA